LGVHFPSFEHTPLEQHGIYAVETYFVGYMLGGFPVVEQQDGGTNQSFVGQLIKGVWKNTLSAYDFKSNTFNTSDLPDDIGATSSVVLHSLDEVGDEGVLIAFAGRWKDIGYKLDNVSNGLCLWALSGLQTKPPNSSRINIPPCDTHLAVCG